MKKTFLLVTTFSLLSLALLNMWRGIGGTYEFSPNTFQVRYVETLYLRLINVPLFHWTSCQRDYMLYPLWKKHGFIQRDKQKQPLWILISQHRPDGRHIDGPAYDIIDIKTVGDVNYWESFMERSPKEADVLFRQVIAALHANDIDTATKLLMTNAWTY